MSKQKLVCTSEWEVDTWKVGKNKIASLSEVLIDDANYKVTSRMVSVPYNDMGHVYHGTSMHYFVKTLVFGYEVEFDLRDIKAKIFPVEYTVEA